MNRKLLDEANELEGDRTESLSGESVKPKEEGRSRRLAMLSALNDGM